MTDFDSDKAAADKVRQAAEHLNGAIIAAARRNLRVEIDTCDLYSVNGSILTRVTVAISKRL